MVETLHSLQHVYSKWEKKSGLSRDTGPRFGMSSTSHMDRITASGRQAWKERFGDNLQAPSYRRRRQRHKGPVFTAVSSTSLIGQFKTTPTILPDTRCLRPFAARCCNCMPNSKNDFFTEDIPNMGLRNILRVDTLDRKNGLLTRSFHHLSFVMHRDVSHKYSDVSLAVLLSPRVTEAIQKSAMENTDDTSKGKSLEKCTECEKKRAASIIQKMKATISNRLIRFTGWFLHKLLGHLLSSIFLHQGQMEMVRKACKKDVPVIFLPTHRSHLDYILITFILFNFDLRAPHVAAGDNLYIPFFRQLMKGLGGYFIRRRLDNGSAKKDYIYRAALHAYMQELLRNKENFEFFVEGGRTRSGKACTPKGGLMSMIVDSYLEGVIPDACIVPVGISYEKILEGNFNDEQMGNPKKPETFLGAVLAIWHLLSSQFGNVRVDFAQPFSLQEYLQVSHGFSVQQNSGRGQCESPDSPPPIGRSLTHGSDSSMYSLEFVSEDQRVVIQGMVEHIIYSCVNVQALMGTHMVAFLMLNKYRQGVSMQQLVTSFDWLKDVVYLKGRDLGFSGETVDVIAYACVLLGDHLIKQQPLANNTQKVKNLEECNNNDIQNIFLVPTVTLPHVFELSYYSNVVLPAFQVDSVLATAVCSLLEGDIGIIQHQETAAPLSKNQVLEKASDLCGLFIYEFVFKPPCASLEVLLEETLDSFLGNEILTREQQYGGCTPSEKQWADRYSTTLGWSEGEDSDDDFIDIPDQTLQLNIQNSQGMEKLAFLQTLLAPMVETYYVTACSLPLLCKQDHTEDQFVKIVHRTLKNRVEQGVAAFAESASLDSVKNAVKSFEHLRVIRQYKEGTTKMISLRGRYKEEGALNYFIEELERYRQ